MTEEEFRTGILADGTRLMQRDTPKNFAADPTPPSPRAREVLEAAKRAHAEMEKGFPRFIQQSWDQLTQLARDAFLARAAALQDKG